MLERLSRYWQRSKISPTNGSPAAALSRDPTYHIWERDGVWVWEVSSVTGHNLGFGRAASSAKARAAALSFWLEHSQY
jgi:hypothetical protein